MSTEQRLTAVVRPRSLASLGPKTGWRIWATLTFSYPLLALFAEPADTGGVPLIVLPAILALMISSVIGFWRASAAERVSLTLAALCFFVINGIVYLTSDVISMEKFIQFNLVLFVFGLATAFSIHVKPLYRSLDVALLSLGLFALVALSLNASEFSAGRITYGDSNPIWMARILGISCIGVFFLGVRMQRHLIIWGAIGLALLVGIVMTGSRGPLLGLGCALAAGVLLYPFPNKLKMLAGGVWVAIFGLLVASIVGGVENLRGLSAGGSDDVSYFLRISVYEYSIRLIELFPEGIGVGSFFYQGFPYPHNIFLEFLAEWGHLFGGIYIALLVLGGIGLFKAGIELRLLLLIYVFEMVNASLSGDITSPRFLYGLAIIGIARLFVRRSRPAMKLRRAPPAVRGPQHAIPGSLQVRSDVPSGR